MRKNFWVWFCNRPRGKELDSINELYIDTHWGDNGKPATNKQVINYIKECKKHKVKPYIVITGLADPDTKREIIDIVEDIEYWSKYAHIVLDYNRFKNLKLENIFKQGPEYLAMYVKKYDKEAKMTCYQFPICFLVGQNIFKLSKIITMLPMLYGGKPSPVWYTNLLIKVHKLLFPKSEPCLPGWDIDKKQLEKYEKQLKKYSIFRWGTYKKL